MSRLLFNAHVNAGLEWRFGSDDFSLSFSCGFLKRFSHQVVYVFKGLPRDAPLAQS